MFGQHIVAFMEELLNILFSIRIHAQTSPDKPQELDFLTVIGVWIRFFQALNLLNFLANHPGNLRLRNRHTYLELETRDLSNPEVGNPMVCRFLLELKVSNQLVEFVLKVNWFTNFC